MGKIRLRHGEDEIEVEGTDQFLQKQIESFYVRIGLASGTTVPTGTKGCRCAVVASANRASKATKSTPVYPWFPPNGLAAAS